MNNNTLKSREYLRVFDLIISQGIKSKGVHEFLDMRAWHDFDGYTCWLAYKDLTVTLLFHGKLSVDFTNKETLNEFSKKINRLCS
jgi:hypothetical protein